MTIRKASFIIGVLAVLVLTLAACGNHNGNSDIIGLWEYEEEYEDYGEGYDTAIRLSFLEGGSGAEYFIDPWIGDFSAGFTWSVRGNALTITGPEAVFDGEFEFTITNQQLIIFDPLFDETYIFNRVD